MINPIDYFTKINIAAGFNATSIALYLVLFTPIDALEVYAREGRVTNEFAFYAKRVIPQQLAALQNILQTRLLVNPITFSQFTYSRICLRVLEQLGQILQTASSIHGFKALRAALILAAAAPEGLTVVICSSYCHQSTKSSIHGQSGLSQIQVPLMLVAGSANIFTPGTS